MRRTINDLHTCTELNAMEFAALCGVSDATVSGWMDDGMPGVTRPGKRQAVTIDINQAVAWVINHRKEPPGSERKRLAKAQAEKHELDNLITRGTLVHSDDVAQELNEWSAFVSQQLEALPGRVAIDGETRQRLLTECRRARADIADYMRTRAQHRETDPGIGLDHAAAADEERGAVGGPESSTAGG